MEPGNPSLRSPIGTAAPVAPPRRRRLAQLPALTAGQRREIAGLLPGLAVHTCVLLFVGCAPAHCDSLWLRAQLPLAVALLLLEVAALWAWPALSAPPLRTPRCVAGRLLFCSVPAFRRMGVGLARAVERPPLPGLLGAVADAIRILLGAPPAAPCFAMLACQPAWSLSLACLPSCVFWDACLLVKSPCAHATPACPRIRPAGTGVSTVVAQGSFARFPPAGQLLLQLALLGLTWKPRAVCASPVRMAVVWSDCLHSRLFLPCKTLACPAPPSRQLLAAPLTRRRVAHAAAALEVVALPWLLQAHDKGALPSVALLAGRADTDRTCVAVVGYGTALVGLLPVILSAHYVRAGQQFGQPRRAVQWLALPWARANAALRWVGRVDPRDGTCVLRAWAFCSLLWQLSLLHAAMDV